MKAFRYNISNRNLRGFNQTGREKNPNQVKYYATNLKYAEKYKFILDEDGDVIEEGVLETVEVESNLFDMNKQFESLDTFKKYANKYLSDMEEMAKSNKYFTFVYENEYTSLVNSLRMEEFQTLSDFETQTDLVNELKSLGFDGYVTNNEVALF